MGIPSPLHRDHRCDRRFAREPTVRSADLLCETCHRVRGRRIEEPRPSEQRLRKYPKPLGPYSRGLSAG